MRRLPRLLTALLFALVLSGWPAEAARAQNVIHVVQPGENLFRIGLRYNVPWSAIMSANGLASVAIYAGQRLVIPANGAAPPPPPAAPAPAPAPIPAAPAPAAPATYTVQPGDTVFRIATRYGLTVVDLAVANNLYDPRFIYAGQTLVIPGAAGASAAPAPVGRQLTVYGQGQALPLDCESRSAVDWASAFGYAINELEFFNGLPASDDPDLGFVGNVYGAWGQLPPAAYGVHAGPVAARLRAYGVKAQALRGATWPAIVNEIDAGRPVLVWVTGHVADGQAYLYVAPSSGNATTVAPFEHTVIVTGYDAETVTVLDGAGTYTRSLAQFLRSWGVLGNMAIVAGP
ncbi:MAG: LysM peptidoglycan-binding domain-containing protein [Anaerolineales bacterium]|nr:LysM peptidoglycan-binding domain-containing protein [Anaerolineales bacterium]